MKKQLQKLKKWGVSCFIMLLTQAVWAQNIPITGIVTGSDDKMPLPGVNILEKGTNNGTITDVNGKYTITVSNVNAVLVFSFIGYQANEQAIGNRSEINLTLEVEATTLEDVVVVGYGVQRKSDLTGSVASVKSDDLKRISAVSPMQALQGKVAGMQVVSASGAPGSGVVIRVRGVGTFNNSNPIFVVDGVILDNIDFLNSSDIESMEVLKDASATTIYGARGANGVIMVTTKQAKKNDKTLINFSHEMSIQKLQKRIDLLDGKEYATIVNEIKPGSYNNLDAVPNTDWQSLIFDDGFAAPIINTQLSASAGSESMQYYIGVGYFSQDGIVPKSNYERLSFQLNNTYKIGSALKIGNHFSLTPYRQQNTNGNVVFVAYRAWPVIEPYMQDSAYSPVPGTGNPLADIEYTNSYNKGTNGTGNFFAELNLFKSLTLKSSYGIEYVNSSSESFTPPFVVSPQQQNSVSRLSKGKYNKLSWMWENTVNFFKELDKHRVDALAGYTMQSVHGEYFSAGAESLTRETPDFWYLNANNINPNTVANGVDDNANYSMMSYLFRLNYTFNNRYMFTGTYRVDGSSKFTQSNRFAGFPALAIGWNLHNEGFMQNIKSISNFKIKGSWGGVGNEKIAYTRQYSLVGNAINGVFGNDVIVDGQTYQTVGNPDLRWETTYQTNVGVELGLLNNRLNFDIDAFRKITTDILIDLQIPGFVGNGGGATITQNAAQILNTGIEFNTKWQSSVGKLKYSAGVLGTLLHNEVLKVRGTGSTDDYLVGAGGLTRSEVGLPVGAFYGYKTNGIFQNQADLDAYPHRADAGIGDLRFVDENGDGKITDADRTYIGSPIPKLMYGINGSLAYNGFDVNIDFQGQYGNQIYNVKETIRPDLYNFEQHVFDRWHEGAPSDVEPRSSQGGYNFLPSSRFVQDGSFFRLRNVSIGYTLNSAITERIKISRARVYISGTNIYTLSKFTGYSPEVMGGPIDSGLDYGTYPITSNYSCGVQFNF